MSSLLSSDSLFREYLSRDAYKGVIIILSGLSTAYVFGLVIYRLLLSPIARFPGPKLAAATGWYETYYDVVKKGKFLFEIERMHQKYGMSLRLGYHSSCCSMLSLHRAYCENQPS